MGLIAREIEAAGIPTVSLSSALSITQAVQPPRSVFVDFPLGRTAGKAHDVANQLAILRAALGRFAEQAEPGEIETLPFEWAGDDSWKDSVMRPDPSGSWGDDRVERWPEPQYQCDRDRELADRALAEDGCPSCVFLEG